jgi:aminopeptidase
LDEGTLEKWADVIVGYALELRPRQVVAIHAAPVAAPLVRAVFGRVLSAGAHPIVDISLPELAEDYLSLANDDQLDYVSPVHQMMLEQFDARVAILSSENTRTLSHVDPAKQARVTAAGRPAFRRFMERSAAGEAAWVVTLFPTNAYAQDAGMSLSAFTRFVKRSMLLDSANPVEMWKGVSARQQRLVDYLGDKDRIHVLGEGTDLWLSVKGRVWINADGRRNLPDGEVFTGPVEESVQGHITFSVPSVRAGRTVEGAWLRFEDGVVVEAQARAGDAYLQEMLNVDAGARRVGEFAFGLNAGITAPTGSTLFDEKIGGTIHLALGSSYPETLGVNTSGLHWDFVCDLRKNGSVEVDGVTLLKGGQLAIEGTPLLP